MTVEIIGRACLAPGANSPQALFGILRQGKCTVTRIPADRWDLARFWHPAIGNPGKTYSFAAGVLDSIYDFDPAAFGMSQREAMYMDPQQRVLLQLAWRALEDANISVPSLHGENVGVYIGASSLDHANLTVEDPAAAGPYFMTGNTLSIVSNRISHIFGLSGPSMTVDTACSSSLVALDQAMRALNAGEIDTAIVGGVNILAHPLPFVGFAQARMLSPEGLCRAYDNDGAGYVRAEGGVVFVLRRSDRARQEKDRSYARIVASGVNSAGRTNGISLPSREAQADLLRSIYDGNNIDANQVAFVEGHGTGTKVGDPAEVWSIGTVIGANRRAPVPIGSIKSNIGHTEPASGLFGMLKAMMALENNYLPASLHFETPNENIDFDALNVRVTANPIELLRGKRARLAGINSFGFGGANAHVVISDPDPAPEERDRSNTAGHVFMASAHTAASLEELLKSYKATFAKVPREESRAIIAASGVNRTRMRHRFAARSDHPEDIVRAIASHLEKPASDIGETGEAVTKEAKVAFVFSGNGSQWAGMGVEAFRENLHFRQCFTSVSALFKFHADISLVDLLTDPDPRQEARRHQGRPAALVRGPGGAVGFAGRHGHQADGGVRPLGRRDRRCICSRRPVAGRRGFDRRQALAASGSTGRPRHDGGRDAQRGGSHCVCAFARPRKHLRRRRQRPQFGDHVRSGKRSLGLPRRRPQGKDPGPDSRHQLSVPSPDHRPGEGSLSRRYS